MVKICPMGSKHTGQCWQCLYRVQIFDNDGKLLGYDCTHPEVERTQKEQCIDIIKQELDAIETGSPLLKMSLIGVLTRIEREVK